MQPGTNTFKEMTDFLKKKAGEIAELYKLPISPAIEPLANAMTNSLHEFGEFVINSDLSECQHPCAFIALMISPENYMKLNLQRPDDRTEPLRKFVCETGLKHWVMEVRLDDYLPVVYFQIMDPREDEWDE